MGELAFIEQIRHNFASSRHKNLTLGIGDDCAILSPPEDSELLVTTDFTLENRHFRRDRHPPESVGHRCLARGLSDLAAMGATPVAAFLSLALPADILANKAGQSWATSFLDGIRALGDLHNVPLAGGDTSQSPANLILADIILIGAAPKNKSLRRSGARPGDILYVTGQLGGAAAELETLLKRRRRISTSTTLDNHPHLYPEPRIDTGEALLRRGLASACLDISDGLSTDLAHLCRASGVQAEVEQSAIPIHPLARKQSPAAALKSALHGGEDYELLFTAPPSTRVPSSIAGVSVTQIGSIKPRRSGHPLLTLISSDGTRSALEPAGWEHFSPPSRTHR